MVRKVVGCIVATDEVADRVEVSREVMEDDSVVVILRDVVGFVVGWCVGTDVEEYPLGVGAAVVETVEAGVSDVVNMTSVSLERTRNTMNLGRLPFVARKKRAGF